MATLLSPLSREQTLKSLDRLPNLSPLMMQFLARLARPDCEVSELTALVGKDALLSAQILRMANSAAFGRAQPITSVQHAIPLVGLGCIRKFALGSSISNLFSRVRMAPHFSVVRFNLHSVATGTLVELIAAEAPFEYSTGAFIAGLLHDIGKLLLAVTMPDEYEHMLSISAINGAPLIECEREYLGTDHAELSELAISRWELAEPIARAARYHHDPDRAPAAPKPMLGLATAVHKANEYVNFLGMSVLTRRPSSDRPPSLDIPGVPSFEAKVLETFESELKSFQDLFK